jgi:hypothetical protein
VSQAVIQAVSKQPNTKSWSFCWLLAYYYRLACVELQRYATFHKLFRRLWTSIYYCCSLILIRELTS